MKTHITGKFLLLIAGTGILIASFGLISWAGGPGNKLHQPGQKHDTIPLKERAHGKDFERELRKLEEAKQQLDELHNKNWDEVEDNLARAIKNLDVEKIHAQVQQAIDKVNFGKITEELETSLRKIDFDKIERDIDAAGKEIPKIDHEKIKQELQRARDEVNERLKKQHWSKELEEIKNIHLKESLVAVEEAKKEIAEVEARLKTEGFNIKESLERAHAGVDKASEKLKGYQEMVSRLEEEGLLNSSDDYTIEFKEGQLYLNGKKQPGEVTNKYRKYFRKETVTIRKRNDEINIDGD